MCIDRNQPSRKRYIPFGRNKICRHDRDQSSVDELLLRLNLKLYFCQATINVNGRDSAVLKWALNSTLGVGAKIFVDDSWACVCFNEIPSSLNLIKSHDLTFWTLHPIGAVQFPMKREIQLNKKKRKKSFFFFIFFFFLFFRNSLLILFFKFTKLFNYVFWKRTIVAKIFA